MRASDKTLTFLDSFRVAGHPEIGRIDDFLVQKE
jgi:hypothetical protein